MSNSANFRQNADQTQALNKLNGLMSTHTTSQTTTTASVDALKLSTDTKLDTINTSLGTLNTSVIANQPPSGVALASNQTTTNTKLDTLNTSLGTLNTSVIANQPPSGVALASNQATTNTKLDTLNTSLTTLNTSVVANLPPSGVALASNQTTTNTKLDTLNTSLTTLNTSVVANLPPSGVALASNQTTAITHLNTIASNSELQGFTNIADNTTGVRLSADSNGRLKVVDQYSTTLANQLTAISSNTAKSRVVSRLTSVPSISANSGGSSYDLGADYGSYKTLKITGDTQGSPMGEMYLQISNDNVNWNFVVGMQFIPLNGGGNMGFFLSSSMDQPLRYWRIFNNSGLDATPSLDSLMSIVSIE